MWPDPTLAQVGDEVHRAIATDLVRARRPLARAAQVDATVTGVLARLSGLGPLEELLAQPGVSEVMVNGPGPVWIERDGVLERTGTIVDRTTIDHVIERVVGPLGLRADRASPLVDARLPDGSRVNAVVPPLAVHGPYVTIRKFATRAVPLARWCAPDVASLLAWAVRARSNVVVSGGTGAGKTTLLNALARLVPPGERIVTVEDTAELALDHPHVVALEARPPSADGIGGVSLRALVRNALRMRPDRLVIGECRGAEALDMLQAMNTGHEGSLSTCHANSPADALRRLETMVLSGDVALPLAAVREQLQSAIDLVVQVARTDSARREVVAVAEVVRSADIGTAEAPAAGARVRLLADRRGLLAVPGRPRRAATVEPFRPSAPGGAP